jgi:outer membrane lipoprotein-sorting protein
MHKNIIIIMNNKHSLMKYLKSLIVIFLSIYSSHITAQDAQEIISKADKKLRGESSYSEIRIKMIRPKWEKEMQLKNWTKGSKLSVSLVTYPAKEKGIVFLKRDQEIWNYVPSIERKIKLPPSMMMQSWMGTDLINDDLVKQSSIVTDYHQRIIGEETVEGLPCWKIELIPHEDAAVVWGKMLIWIDKNDYMQMKAEFYDEDNFLVNSMLSHKPKIFDGKKLPSVLEFIPWEKDGNKTIIEYKVLRFDTEIKDEIFTIRYMKRLK